MRYLGIVAATLLALGNAVTVACSDEKFVVASDAGVTPEADGGRFCARADANLCEDFDDPALSAGWVRAIDPGATVGFSSNATSLPSSALFTIGAAPKSCAYGQITRSLSPADHHRIAFDAMYGAPGVANAPYVFVVGLMFSAADANTFFFVTPGGVDSSTSGVLQQTYPKGGSLVSKVLTFGPAAKAGRFAHYELELDLTPGAPTIVLRVDGDSAAPRALDGTLVGARAAQLRLGLNCISDTVPHEVRLDNVVYNLF